MDTSGGGPYTDIQESGIRHLPPSIPEKCDYQKNYQQIWMIFCWQSANMTIHKLITFKSVTCDKGETGTWIRDKTTSIVIWNIINFKGNLFKWMLCLFWT